VAIGEDMDIAGFGASISSRQAAMKASAMAFTRPLSPWPSNACQEIGGQPVRDGKRRDLLQAAPAGHAVNFENLEGILLSRIISTPAKSAPVAAAARKPERSSWRPARTVPGVRRV